MFYLLFIIASHHKITFPIVIDYLLLYLYRQGTDECQGFIKQYNLYLVFTHIIGISLQRYK